MKIWVKYKSIINLNYENAWLVMSDDLLGKQVSVFFFFVKVVMNHIWGFKVNKVYSG